jgi:hypothetical protein
MLSKIVDSSFDTTPPPPRPAGRANMCVVGDDADSGLDAVEHAPGEEVVEFSSMKLETAGYRGASSSNAAHLTRRCRSVPCVLAHARARVALLQRRSSVGGDPWRQFQ